jgi:hypothetical protein
MFSVFALLSVFVLLSAIVTWVTYGRRRTRFLPDFESLLERPELVDGFSDLVAARSFLKGEFRGRNVVILVQHGDEDPTLVVSMETHAALTMDTYDFAGYKADREGELALFALEVKHELMLRHMDGYLKAQRCPLGFFPRSFDRSKWQSVLEAMDTLAGSIERRASASTVAAAR